MATFQRRWPGASGIGLEADKALIFSHIAINLLHQAHDGLQDSIIKDNWRK